MARTDAGNRNRLLELLPAQDRKRLLDQADSVELEVKELLFPHGAPIERVYFPTTAVVSVLTLVGDRDQSGVEIATIGNEGLVGLLVFLGATSMNPREVAQVQMPGNALCVETSTCLEEVSNGRALLGIVRRYTQAFLSQVSQQVACNGLHTIEERCSRWLLLTHDRVGADEFPLTHEFLAQMLGVRRPSITVVAGALQQAGFIRLRRGRVTITDRAGLEGASCECYRVICEVFDPLLR